MTDKKKSGLNKFKNKSNKVLKDLKPDKTSNKKSIARHSKEIKSISVKSNSQYESFLKNALYSIVEAVIVTDAKLKIIQMNASAEKLCGYKESGAINKSLKNIFKIVNKASGKQIEFPSINYTTKKIAIGPASDKLLISKNGKKIPISESTSTIKNKNGTTIGFVVVLREQNEERENQKVVEERERNFSTLVSNLPGFIYRRKFDNYRTMELISDGCKKITGYSPSDFINNKKISFIDLIPNNYRKQVRDKWQKVIKEKSYFEFEYPIITRSGKLNWIWERGRGVYSNEGKLQFLEGFIVDVSERRNTEALLKESENRYKSFFDSSPDAIFLADPETNKIIDANKSALNLLKMPYSKVVGMHQTQLHPKRLLSYSKSTFSRHLNESELKIPFENFVLASDGKEIPVEVLASVVNLNGKKVLQGVFRNITERRKIENALAESENKFRLFFEHSKDAMLLLDGKVFFDCNKAAVELMGCTSKEQILSNHPSVLSPKFQPDGELSFKKAGRLMKQAYRDGVARFEWVHKKINGEEFPVEVTLTSVPISGKQILFTIWRDISERKIFETEIQRSKERMQLLVEGTPHLFFYVQNLDAMIQYISPSVKNITGYSVDEWMNQKHWFITDSLINETAKNRTHAHLKGEVNTDAVYLEILHANGSKVMLEVYERPIIADKKVIGLQGVAHDITERIRFEENLKQSELSYKGLFESVSESIYIQDESGVFLDVNEGACRMYGYDKKSLIGKTPDFVSAPGKNNLKLVRDLAQKAFMGEKQQFDFWGKRKNGEVFLKDVRLYPGNYFNQKVVIAIANDITEKKKAEELIKESEEKYRTLAENLNDVLYSLTKKGVISYISGAIKYMLGYEPDEVIGKTFSEFFLKEDLLKFPTQYKKILSDTKEPVEFRLIEKSGKVHWIRSSSNALYEDNKLAGFQGVMVDINNEKLIEAKLKESEERYRIISNITSDYLFSTKADEKGVHKLFWIAGSFEKITGYTFEEYRKVGGWRARLHPEELELDDLDLELLRKNQKVNREIRTYHKNGSLVWVRSYAHPIWDDETNKLIGVYGAVQDITERKQAEIIQKVQYKIADAAVTYKTITELFENIRVELSALINVNNFFIALYDEKTGMLRSDVDRDEVEEIAEWPAKDSMTGYVIQQEKSVLLKKNDIINLIESGEAGMIGVIPEVWLGVPFKIAGKVFGVLVVQSYDNPNAYDQKSIEILEIVAHELSIFITHKKAEEETLKLSTAVIQSPTIVIITDTNGNIEYVNPKFTEVTGYTLEEAKWQNPRILNSGSHDKDFYSNLWNTILSGKIWHGEFQNRKKNGELYWENALISPIIDLNGNITHFVAVKEDVTLKKKMIQELIEAKENAEEMNRIKSSFFANMSHELRTPMVGILGFSEVLMSELESNPELFRMVQSINLSGQRLLETLNLILNLSKIDAGKVEAKLKIVNIVPLIQECFSFFGPVADKKGLTYKFSCDYDELLCELDILLFQSIFNNLLNNALKFTAKGSVSININLIPDFVIIQVSDTGVGISDEKLNIIWDEFRQASEGYNRSFEGTGLGLTIAKKYTDLLKGSIVVNSKVGLGTTFTLKFPISKTESNGNEKMNQITDNEFSIQLNPDNMPSILYVEDDEIAVKLVSTITKGCYKIDSAKDSDEALKKISSSSYHAILMDINLHRGMDGLELTGIIRKNENYKTIPIIALTAFAMGEERKEFLSKGMTHYLSKPFTKSELIKLLDTAIKDM